MGGGIEYRVVSQLLTSIDDLKPSSKVVVVGATSKLSSVDPALRRFGRFDHEVEIGVPGYVDRLELLLLHSKNMKLQEDVDLEKVGLFPLLRIVGAGACDLRLFMTPMATLVPTSRRYVLRLPWSKSVKKWT